MGIIGVSECCFFATYFDQFLNATKCTFFRSKSMLSILGSLYLEGSTPGLYFSSYSVNNPDNCLLRTSMPVTDPEAGTPMLARLS